MWPEAHHVGASIAFPQARFPTVLRQGREQPLFKILPWPSGETKKQPAEASATSAPDPRGTGSSKATTSSPFPPDLRVPSVHGARMSHVNRNQVMPLSGPQCYNKQLLATSHTSSKHLTLVSGKPPSASAAQLTKALATSGPLHLLFSSLDHFSQSSAWLRMSPPQMPSVTALPTPRLGACHVSQP